MTWKCSQCEEAIEESFQVCWNCGSSRDGSPNPEFRRADDPIIGEQPSRANQSNTTTSQLQVLIALIVLACFLFAAYLGRADLLLGVFGLGAVGFLVLFAVTRLRR